MRLFEADEYERERDADPGGEVSPQRGTPYGMSRGTLVAPLELPCVKPPWGHFLAVDLATGEVMWETALGITLDIGPLRVPLGLEPPNIGGSLVTASGIIFIGAAMDNRLRAFDIATGQKLWEGRLPAGGQANPMTYRLDENGRQFVVIAAGGNASFGTMLGDSIVAFALPETRTAILTSVSETLLYVGVALVMAFLLARFGKYVLSRWLWFPLLAVFVIIFTETGWLMTQSVGAMALSFGLALVSAFLLTRMRRYRLARRSVSAA